MPCRKGRKRWRKSLYCMPLPRPCIDSFPRRYMPHCPVYRPCPSQHVESNSSLSDYSCPGEEYCTVENCRNAPMCINAQPQYCPYGYNEQPPEEFYARPATAHGYERDSRQMNRSANRMEENYSLGYPQAASTPYPPPCFRQGSYPTPQAQPSAQNRPYPVLQRPPECPFHQMSQNMNAPCRPQVPVNCPATEYQRVMGSIDSNTAQSQSQIQQRLPSTQSSLFIPESDTGRDRDQKATNQYPSQFPLTDEPTLSQNFQTSRESVIQEADHTKPQCLNKGKGYCSRKGKCNKELAFESSTTYHTLPEPSSSGLSTSNFGPDIHSTPVPYKPDGSKRSMNVPSSIGYRQSHMQPPETDRMKQQSEMPIPYIHDAVSTSIHTGKFDGTKCPCPCRYPPAFKHFSCTGNINGSCNCGGHDLP